ncbi:hypothetical protein E2562_015232 [Oryza meyeriana var. granulata]|uniref:Uncharacterized protein n=1 Tax=Oryza meyeriana var. granulata TaxID=110450 RepID=A0A6G1EWX3_9ORYZ|nr:hypothetical protein E2562_015232 [Oryza meyeriana var. granulata]
MSHRRHRLPSPSNLAKPPSSSVLAQGPTASFLSSSLSSSATGGSGSRKLEDRPIQRHLCPLLSSVSGRIHPEGKEVGGDSGERRAGSRELGQSW